MCVLSVDSATDIGALGLINGDRVLGEVNIHLHHRQSERLLINLKNMLKEAEVNQRELEGLAVGLGPGSFTGLRIGVTMVKTMAQFLEIPVVGLSTLEILAAGIYHQQGWLLPVIDARNSRVYTAMFAGGDLDMQSARHLEDRVLPVEKLLAELADFEDEARYYLTGSGALAYREMFAESELDIVFPGYHASYPRGAAAASLGQFYLQQGREDDYRSLAPIYLKKAHG